MTKKLVNTFKGELFLCDNIFVKESLKSLSKPDSQAIELKKVNLIYDEDNKCRYLVGDFEGDDLSYAYTIKLFLYEDGKALGNLKYIVEAKLPIKRIRASYLPFNESGFKVHGFFEVDGKEGRDSFILFLD